MGPRAYSHSSSPLRSKRMSVGVPDLARTSTSVGDCETEPPVTAQLASRVLDTNRNSVAGSLMGVPPKIGLPACRKQPRWGNPSLERLAPQTRIERATCPLSPQHDEARGAPSRFLRWSPFKVAGDGSISQNRAGPQGVAARIVTSFVARLADTGSIGYASLR